MMSTTGWEHQQDHQMATDDDFGHFLDISNMNGADAMNFDYGFQDTTAQAQAQAQAQVQAQQHIMNRQREQPDTMMGDSSNAGVLSPNGGMMHSHNTAMSSAGPSSRMMATSGPGNDSISTIDAQIHYLQQQKFHQQQRAIQEQRSAYFTHNHSVPPTPQSIEIPPGSGHFYSQQEVYERNYHHQQRLKEQDMAFTPLVSPAVTPLDPQFSIDNAFTVPGAYFSPLTSPALHAQTDSGYDHSTHSNNSPVEMDLESGPISVTSTLELSKKARKNSAAKTRSKAGVRSSPISKPQRKKAGPSPAIVSHVLTEVEERNDIQPEPNFLPLPAASTDGSEENASVSPENLNDMPPPPVPAWKSTKSPYMQPQNGNGPTSAPNSDNTTPTGEKTPIVAPTNDLQAHPATPASLMRLPASKSKQHVASQHEQTATDHIESLELPESVSKKQFAPIDTQLGPRDSPRIEPFSSKSTTSKTMPSPSIRRPGTASANQSPQIRPGSTGPSARKTPNIAPRMGRKRSSGSVQVSPALLPRISPNIRPLLPGGDSAETDASRLLTSKSNYQNILEGNMVPGVTYPSELSSNLTSKRTSHKIAEQGRRNRINSALQIMASLLPDHQKVGSGEGDDDDKKEGKQANASNSKASVVEKAIVHMQHLEQENTGLKQELQELKDQMEKLKSPS